MSLKKPEMKQCYFRILHNFVPVYCVHKILNVQHILFGYLYSFGGLIQMISQKLDIRI